MNKQRRIRNKRVPLKMLDLVTLLHNAYKASKHNEVGFSDAHQTLEMLTNNLIHRTWVQKNTLESLLWSCNMLDELGVFWHPSDLTFEEFLNRILNKDKQLYDKNYCVIEEEEEYDTDCKSY